jgi:hypothetical protein
LVFSVFEDPAEQFDGVSRILLEQLGHGFVVGSILHR